MLVEVHGSVGAQALFRRLERNSAFHPTRPFNCHAALAGLGQTGKPQIEHEISGSSQEANMRWAFSLIVTNEEWR